MSKENMKVIANRTADLAIGSAEDELFSREDYYREYLDQLQSGDSQTLRYWIGSKVENGIREAVEILKMWIRAELAMV